MKHATYHKETLNSSVAKKTVSTLLIPEQYLAYFNKQCLKHKGRANYFQYILDRFASQVKFYEKKLIKGKKDKWKTYYQAQDQDLYRRNFRPSSVHWEQCRHTANSFGVSMCYLFVFLLELEIQGLYTVKQQKSRNTTNKSSEKMTKFFCCIRRVDFFPKSLKRLLIFRC